MLMTSRDQFEQAYAEDHNCTLEWCQSQRLSNGSYLDRYMARAWRWWEFGKNAA
jgi:hypothetical protein